MAGVVDSEIARWLSAHPAPDIDYRDVSAVRALFGDYMSEQGGPAPRWPRDDVELTPLTVGGVEALMWRPRALNDPPPVVVAFHGGAFIVGGPLGAERLAAPLAGEHGVCTISVAYRLAPENPAPAALDDARHVLEALDGIPGIDTQRVVVHGSSAGACIAAGLALHARDIGYRLALQSLSCPALDSRAVRTSDPVHSMAGLSPTLSRSAVKAMWSHYLGDRSPADASMRYVVPALASDLVGLASAHITVAEHDVLRDEALDYADRLTASGVRVELDLVAGAVHGFDGLLPEGTLGQGAIRRQIDAIVAAVSA